MALFSSSLRYDCVLSAALLLLAADSVRSLCVDCAGADCSGHEHRLGDGTCDNATHGADSLDFQCLTHGFDMGDCLRSAGDCPLPWLDANPCTGSCAYSVNCTVAGSLVDLTFDNYYSSAPASFIETYLCSELHQTTLRTLVLKASLAYDDTLPNCLGSLQALTQLVASYSDLSGTIPQSLTSLTRLRTLDLETTFILDKGLTGTLPQNLGAWSHMEYLEMRGNSLSGSVPSSLGSLTNATYIRLMGAGLSGTLPSSIGSLTRMYTVPWSSNQFTGALPASIASWSCLDLFLDHCSFSGTLPNLPSTLTDLNLNGNSFSGTLPASLLAERSNLFFMDLAFNSFTGQLPNAWWNSSVFHPLQGLILSNNQLTGPVPANISARSYLTLLHLDGNSLTSTIPSSLCSLIILKDFSVAENGITGTIPSCISPNLPLIRALDLSFNSLSGTIPSEMAGLQTLGSLDLSTNQLTGTLNVDLDFVSSMKLRNNLLSGTLPEAWWLADMTLISLSSNRLTGQIPQWWGDMWNLESLVLSDNQLTGTIPAEFGASDLVTFEASSNQLTGTLPMLLLNASLRRCDFSLNQLSGPLLDPGPFPEYWGSLSFLALSSNALTGTIPQSIASLKRLSVLDLSRNNLSGEVPSSLYYTTEFVALVVSENNLTGTLATAGGYFTYYGPASLYVLAAHSNGFSDFHADSWCAAESLANCDLSGNTDPRLPCEIQCSGFNINLTELCQHHCPCAAMAQSDGEHLAWSSSTDCPASVHGTPCEFKCEAGFEPGLVSPFRPVADPPPKVVSPHVASCVAGLWSFSDANGVEHGCVEKGCEPMLSHDIANADLSQCSSAVAAGSSCQISCQAGYTLSGGDGIVNCSRGAWQLLNTTCVAHDSIFAKFECEGLTDAQIHHVASGSCRGTLGRPSTGVNDRVFRSGETFSFAQDFLLPDWCIFEWSWETYDYEERCFENHPGECEYACANGFYADPRAPVAQCDLGAWLLEGNGPARCLPRNCSVFWTDWDECTGFCEDAPDPGKEWRTFVYDSSQAADVAAALLCGSLVPIDASLCPSEPGSLPACTEVEDGELCRSNGECGTDAALNNCNGSAVYLREHGQCPPKGSVSGYKEARNCTVRPRCGIGSCDDFWCTSSDGAACGSNFTNGWSDCNRLCADGNQTRHFVLLADDLYANFTNEEFVTKQCFTPVGTTENRPCVDYNATCEADIKCDDFYSLWTECDRFCDGGSEYRTYEVPVVEGFAALRYHMEVCRSDYAKTVLGKTYPDDAFFVEQRSCTSWPRCRDYNCSDFFGNWSECSEICDGGVEVRTFQVPAEVNATMYNQEVCQGPYGNLSYGRPYPQSGGVESRPCTSHPSCDDFDCMDFFTEWSECSRLCEGGVENRTFLVPPEAEEYNRRVCQAAYGQQIYPFPTEGGLDVRACENGNGYPSCGAYNCSDFFGSWSECDAFCGGGVETRTFVVPDTPLALRYDREVCRQQCLPENGGTETRLCEDGGGYPNCNKYNCSDFFTQWSECDAFCFGGTESRTYQVPLDDADAASFESEVCQGGWQGTFPVHDAVEVRQCEFGNGYPRCSDYDCDDFFSAWGECNRFCSGGNESRTYMVPSGDPEAAKYDSEVCQVVALDMPREIAYPVNGSSVTRPCELGGGYPRCNAFDCNDFFTEWTACNRVCFGGNQSRRFIVPADDPVAQRYNTEVCQAHGHGGALASFPPNGTTVTASCEAVAGADAYPDCELFQCDSFYSEWSECDAMCADGHQYREYNVPANTTAQQFDSEVCQRSGQYPQDGVREIRDCSDDLYLPQCERYSCDGFWSNFSECSEKCPAHGDGGVVTRTLVVPFNDTFATRFYTEMCEGKPFVISGTRAVYPNLPGGQQTLGCDHVAPTLGGGHPACEAFTIAQNQAVGGSVSSILVIGGGVALILVLFIRARKNKKLEEEVRRTRVGQFCLRVAGGRMRKAVTMVVSIDELQRQFRDMKPHAIWFALGYGSRPKQAAAELLQRAVQLRSKRKSNMSIVEALERAEWSTNVADLFPIHRRLLHEDGDVVGLAADVADFIASLDPYLQVSDEEVGRGGLASRDVPEKLLSFPAFVHIAVSWPWQKASSQAECVSLLLKKLHPGFVDRLYRPRPLPQGDDRLKVNVFQHAVERGCAPAVLHEVFKSRPQQSSAVTPAAVAEICGQHAFTVGAYASMTQEILARRLAWRISSEDWEQDPASHHTGNGTAWFVPPCVKARELKVALTRFAEELLRHEWQRQSRQGPEVDGDTELLDEDDADASDEEWMVVPKRQEVVHCRPVQRRKSTIERTHTLRAAPSEPRLKMSKISPEQRTNSAADLLKNMNDGSLESIISTSMPNPWATSFELAFVRPCLAVLKSFLQQELQLAAENLTKLRELCEVLMGGFQGIYKAIATKFVEPDPGLPRFNEIAAQIAEKARRHPQTIANGKPAQAHADLVRLYIACYRVGPRFASFHADVKKRTNAMEGSDVGPLKSMYRAMEKAAFRDDGKQWSADNVLDIVRGSLLFDRLEQFTLCLQVLEEYPGVTIARVKNRFQTPTDGGWRDCMVNVCFDDDPDHVICELQLIHHTLMLARKGMNGHNDYVTYRSGIELQLAVAAQKLQNCERPSQAVSSIKPVCGEI